MSRFEVDEITQSNPPSLPPLVCVSGTLLTPPWYTQMNTTQTWIYSTADAEFGMDIQYWLIVTLRCMGVRSVDVAKCCDYILKCHLLHVTPHPLQCNWIVYSLTMCCLHCILLRLDNCIQSLTNCMNSQYNKYVCTYVPTVEPP